MWRRTFDATGFSPLKQIDRGNVRQLQKVWSLPLDPSSNEITPLVHDGVLFVFSGSGVQAVEAATGKPLWRYEREFARPNFARAQSDGRRPSEARRQSSEYGGQRKQSKSVALYGHSLLVPTSDGHLLALDTRSGKILWDHAINGAPNGGLQLSSGPLVARGVVMIGASLGLTNKGGCFIVGLDAVTGEERWRCDRRPANWSGITSTIDATCGIRTGPSNAPWCHWAAARARSARWSPAARPRFSKPWTRPRENSCSRRTPA
jgi:alcohol dehydrogenase (cytochrome c)